MDELKTASGHLIHHDPVAISALSSSRPAVRHKPGIMGQSPKIADVRHDPFWGPILFPLGPDGGLDEKELAAHLSDYEALIDGAARVVTQFALGMTGGYKAYTADAVIQQIQEGIDRDRELSGDDDDCGDAVVERVVADLRSRSATGQAKYGCTLDRSDLTPEEWLEHVYQELLDAVNYLSAHKVAVAAVPACLDCGVNKHVVRSAMPGLWHCRCGLQFRVPVPG